MSSQRSAVTVYVVVLALMAALAATLAAPNAARADEDPARVVAASVTFERAPADAGVSEVISSLALNADGPPIAVGVGFAVDRLQLAALIAAELETELRQEIVARGGSINPALDRTIRDAVAAAGVPAALDAGLDTADVSIAIDRDPAGDMELMGTTTRALDDGTATFDDLSIASAGRGFTLAATVEPIVVDVVVQVPFRVSGRNLVATASPDDVTVDPDTSAPSPWFTIWDEVCSPPTPCTAMDAGAGLRADFQSLGSDGTLMLNMTDEQLCGGIAYQGLPQGVLVDSLGDSGPKVVTFTIDRATVQIVRDDGKSKYDICMVSDTPFIGKGGQPAPSADAEDGDPLTYGPALLPDCGNPGNIGAPCIASRTGTQGGDAVIVVHLPAGDPWMR